MMESLLGFRNFRSIGCRVVTLNYYERPLVLLFDVILIFITQVLRYQMFEVFPKF